MGEDELTPEQEWLAEVRQSQAAVKDLIVIAEGHPIAELLQAVDRHLDAAATIWDGIDHDELNLVSGV